LYFAKTACTLSTVAVLSKFPTNAFNARPSDIVEKKQINQHKSLGVKKR
jgi:hypothetical protein